MSRPRLVEIVDGDKTTTLNTARMATVERVRDRDPARLDGVNVTWEDGNRDFHPSPAAERIWRAFLPDAVVMDDVYAVNVANFYRMKGSLDDDGRPMVALEWAAGFSKTFGASHYRSIFDAVHRHAGGVLKAEDADPLPDEPAATEPPDAQTGASAREEEKPGSATPADSPTSSIVDGGFYLRQFADKAILVFGSGAVPVERVLFTMVVGDEVVVRLKDYYETPLRFKPYPRCVVPASKT